MHFCIKAEAMITMPQVLVDPNESPSHVEPFPFNEGLVYMTCSEVMASSRGIQAELDKPLHTGASFWNAPSWRPQPPGTSCQPWEE